MVCSCRDSISLLTDFGLARTLVNSRAYTYDLCIRCLGDISPERIERTGGYGTTADIWSIGPFVELATGKHPILSQAVRENGELLELDIFVDIVELDPPRLTGYCFSDNLKNFVGREMLAEEVIR